jgi:hypothetical protein
VTPERQTSSNEHLCTNLVLCIRPDFDATTKQDQAAIASFGTKGNSEKK